jgi:hypothetical protein
MSEKYPSTDTYTMAEAARRFNTLFGFFPEYIGVNPGNKEAIVRKCIRFPRIKDYIDTLLSQNPEFLLLTSPAPSITMQDIPIKEHSGIGFNDFILWHYKTGNVTPELVFNVNGETVFRMIDAMGYRCLNYSKSNMGYDLFTVRDRDAKDLYVNLSVSHYKYEYPEHLKVFIENALTTRFKQAKQPQNKTVGELDVKINVDASELVKHLKTPQKETINTMAKPAQQTAKVIFPLNGEMYELELNEYSFTQEIDILKGLTCHIEGSSLHGAKPLKKKAAAGRLTLDGTTYELYPVTEL